MSANVSAYLEVLGFLFEYTIFVYEKSRREVQIGVKILVFSLYSAYVLSTFRGKQ